MSNPFAARSEIISKYEEIDREMFLLVCHTASNIEALDNMVRPYPTIAKAYHSEVSAMRERLNDILSRMERNWNQKKVAAE